MAKLSEEKIAEIRRIYKELGTYSGTAKAVGCSPASVKKYCQEEYISDPAVRVIFNGILPSVEKLSWPSKEEEEISNMARLTEAELEEIKELWKEL